MSASTRATLNSREDLPLLKGGGGEGGPIKEVTIGEEYTGKVPALPETVEKLIVHAKSITFTSFPTGLHHLEFGFWFNSPLEVPLPPALQVLIFGFSFNQPVEHLLLPRTHHTLKFGDSFNQ